MSEEQKDCELLFQEVKQVRESSRLNASFSDQKKPLVLEKRKWIFVISAIIVC